MPLIVNRIYYQLHILKIIYKIGEQLNSKTYGKYLFNACSFLITFIELIIEYTTDDASAPSANILKITNRK
ncbi:hypothetical protein Q766_01420 [Flavobacterium subsaxonicum WB 4.1-42 = DSM 21790]|uniref:Uncharacterized protein n=1 Tax=Flavobacterium subsaxonicum WB 4.1-42 = DSM 21790 TaxID=1121898 RepID=A0A0A2MT80_9FLAO|nr:hypothetical protein Q766_01420 [Flavobacterium subsaxonicum WB 4.1-42 = DSM 21790]